MDRYKEIILYSKIFSITQMISCLMRMFYFNNNFNCGDMSNLYMILFFTGYKSYCMLNIGNKYIYMVIWCKLYWFNTISY